MKGDSEWYKLTLYRTPTFGHANIITFKDKDGQLIRPFSSIEEHDETIIDNHNKLVKPQDRVYVMGDICIHRKSIPMIGRLNGRKKLLRGNHDVFKLKDYTPYFDDIDAYRVYPEQGIIFSHIPVHPAQSEHRFKWNAHGHLHSNLVMREIETTVGIDLITCEPVNHKVITPDKRYLNLCLEHTGFKPVSFDEICEKIGWEKNK